jgi:hypothetical protein
VVSRIIVGRIIKALGRSNGWLVDSKKYENPIDIAGLGIQI